jgi:hypothetical protein
MESRRLHEEFSDLSRLQSGAPNINTEARVSYSTVNLSTDELHGDAVGSGLKPALNLQTNTTCDIELFEVFSSKGILLV